MPWNTRRYPVSMRNLEAAVREKAIEIANALLAQGVPDDHAIRIAIAQAKRWADRHPYRPDSYTGNLPVENAAPTRHRPPTTWRERDVASLRSESVKTIDPTIERLPGADRGVVRPAILRGELRARAVSGLLNGVHQFELRTPLKTDADRALQRSTGRVKATRFAKRTTPVRRSHMIPSDERIGARRRLPRSLARAFAIQCFIGRRCNVVRVDGSAR
jgi:hypothetical protein